jgi:23S rRNA (guanosine2251-2'-O)-methyltransferase
MKGRKVRGTGPRRTGPRPGQQLAIQADPDVVRLFGFHAVEAALRNPDRAVVGLIATDNAQRRLGDIIGARKITPRAASPRDLDRMLGADTVHQGVLLETRPLPEPSLDDLGRWAISGGPLVVLDQVTDPHNVGAVLRSAAVFGAAGLVMTRRHSPPLDGVLAKSASGALELIPVLLVQNLARTLLDLRAQGFTLLGLDDEASARIEDEPFRGKTAIVLGAEGKGLRELTGETCDRLVRISTAGTLSSLNVSNAAAIALHVSAMARSK